MKILIIGLGSMGKRRIRLLKNYFLGNDLIGVDFNDTRRAFVQKEYAMKVYQTIDEAIEKEDVFNVAFICTSPLAHKDILAKCLLNNMNIFSELDLVCDGYEQNLILAKRKKLKMFLSSTPMYHKEIEYITDNVKNSTEKLSYIYHVGQYLPDWHPWENYKDFFVNNKKTNACREIFAIELPWLINAFGEIVDWHVLASKNTSLDIDYNDNYIVTLNHTNGNKGVFVVDVVCRQASKKMEIFGENTYILWDGVPNSLVIKDCQNNIMQKPCLFDGIDKLEQYSGNIIENMYLQELKDFFAVLDGISCGRYNYEDSEKILHLIDAFEEKGEQKNC